MFFSNLHKLLVSTSSGAKVSQFEFVSDLFCQKRSPGAHAKLRRTTECSARGTLCWQSFEVSCLMPEKRTNARHRVLKTATIEFGGGAIDCMVRNMSGRRGGSGR